MGYSEVMCQLCGVSSNIARLRTKDESPLASWSCNGYDSDSGGMRSSYVDSDTWDPEECPDCLFTSPPDFPDVEVEADWDDEKKRGTSDWPQENFRPYKTDHDPETSVDLQDKSESVVDSEDKFDGRSEHIAAPNCGSTSGFNGHNISVEEMRLCGTMQCLVPKGPDWQPESDDEEFETDHDAQYFLSGLADFLESRDMGSSSFEPARHGEDEPFPDNVPFDADRAEDLAMPFHPSCFEVYKRASIARTGRVDVRALTDWFRLDTDYSMFFNRFPRDQAVRDGEEQWWQHNPGDEWLAANPLFVPKLQEILRESTNNQECTTNVGRHSLDNDLRADELMLHRGQATAPDVFERLSLELCLNIVSYLGGHDIANLRRVSRAFWIIPQSVFRELLLREQPWLWEAWCDRPYPMWAATTSRELRRLKEPPNPERRFPDQTDEEFEQWKEQEKKRRATRLKELLQPRLLDALPKLSTDWYTIYTTLNKNWRSILGLRNRKRIWADCNYILDRIDLHKLKSRMGNGIVVDPVAAFNTNEEAGSDLDGSDKSETE